MGNFICCAKKEKEKEKPNIDFELKDVCDDDTNVDAYSIINANVSQDILSVHSSFWLREALDYRDYWDNQDDQDYSIFQQYLDYQATTVTRGAEEKLEKTPL